MERRKLAKFRLADPDRELRVRIESVSETSMGMAGDTSSWINPLRRGARMYARWQEKSVRAALATMRVVILSGARQTGKTTLARTFATSDSLYRSLDAGEVRVSASNDLASFIRHERGTMVIDEVQKVPDLLSEIKHSVDVDQRPGRYLLTGSADVLALPCVRESLAGRAQVIRLRPLTRGEVSWKPPLFFERAFGLEFRSKEGNLDYLADPHGARNRENYLLLAMAGGYPEAIAVSHEADRARWHAGYIQETLSRDMKDAARIHRMKEMETLLMRLAAWSSKVIDHAKIGRHLDLSRPTLRSYVNTVEMMLVVDRVPAWVDSAYEWGMRRDKLFLSDSGLMAGMLEWSRERVLTDADVSGKLMETYVHNQLAALIDAHRPEYRLFHYRDKGGREIDFVVRDRSGNLLGIKVKVAATVERGEARHLRWFGETHAKGKKFVGLILHTGGGVHRLEENVWAVPISILWEE